MTKSGIAAPAVLAYGELKQNREKRCKLVADAQELLETLTDESTPEEVADTERHFDERMDAADKFKAVIDREERLAGHTAQLDQTASPENRAGREDIETATNVSDDEREHQRQEYEGTFRNWAAHGMSGLSDEERSIMQRGEQNLTEEMRAQSAGTDAGGGFLVPEGFRAELDIAMAQFGGMRQAADVFVTASGNDLPWPTTNDSAQTGELLGENTAATEQDVTFGATTLQAFMYSSKMVRVSLQLLQDSAISMDQVLGALLGERLGRITNTHFTTGTGSSQPNGVVTAATLGKTAASATAITHDELLDLKHSVDPAYRAMGSVRWMFNDSTLKAIKKLKDKDGRPLWQVNVQIGEPDVIDGDRYAINQDVASIATDAKTILYGDFAKYKIRDSRDITMLRLSERYAELLQVAFLAFMRSDGDLIDAGAHPIKYLQQA